MVKIFVGNVQAESCKENEAELKHLFEQFGEVSECDILTGKNFAFVHMEKEDEAEAAINALDGAFVFGGNIGVEKSANQTRGRASRGARTGGGYDSHRGYDSYRGHSRGGSRYRPYSRSYDDPYSLYDDPYARYPYPLPRDPYGRDAYLRELYARELYARDAYFGRYGRDPYARGSRDPYERDNYRRSGAQDRSYHGRSSRDYYDKDKSLSSAADVGGDHK